LLNDQLDLQCTSSDLGLSQFHFLSEKAFCILFISVLCQKIIELICQHTRELEMSFKSKLCFL